MRVSLLSLVLLYTITLALACSGEAAPPNIVILLTDDQGWKDVGYHGAEFATPGIDRIALEGIELDRFYATPICTATRAGLLTGRYPIRFGLQDATIKRWEQRTIPEGEVLLPQLLAKAGYQTRAMIGKWHLGWSHRGDHPLSRGFTSFYGMSGGTIDYFTHEQYGALDWHRDWELSEDRGYSTDLIGREAVRLIEQSENEPFFLYVAFNAVHTPSQALAEDYRRFGELADEKRRVHAAMATALDRQIGFILDALDRKGIARRTLVLFMSDNGGNISSGSSNEPLRGGKWSVYEGGIRLPAAIRWPDGLQGGRKLAEPISYLDIYPTLMRIVGAEEPGGERLDGEDVLEVLRGKTERANWVLHSYFAGRLIPQNSNSDRQLPFERNAVNTRQWKLVRLGPDAHRVDDPKKDARIELYRIDDDPYERHNLARERPEIVSSLLEKLRAFRATQSTALDEVSVMPPRNWKPPPNFRIPD